MYKINIIILLRVVDDVSPKLAKFKNVQIMHKSSLLLDDVDYVYTHRDTYCHAHPEECVVWNARYMAYLCKENNNNQQQKSANNNIVCK